MWQALYYNIDMRSLNSTTTLWGSYVYFRDLEVRISCLRLHSSLEFPRAKCQDGEVLPNIVRATHGCQGAAESQNLANYCPSWPHLTVFKKRFAFHKVCTSILKPGQWTSISFPFSSTFCPLVEVLQELWMGWGSLSNYHTMFWELRLHW